MIFITLDRLIRRAFNLPAKTYIIPHHAPEHDPAPQTADEIWAYWNDGEKGGPDA